MKSSSQLFPVELVSAEMNGNVYQDLYSLKPNKSKDKTVQIALLHLHACKDSSLQRQVLFLHDAFNSHWQWMDDGESQMLIDDLLSNGYSVWLMDWRAHGSSRKNKLLMLNTIEEMANCDLPAVVSFIQEKNQQPLYLVAKGYGAQMALKVMPELSAVYQFLFINARSVLASRLLWIPGVRAFKWIRLLGKSWVSGQGSEQEPVSLFRSQLKEGGLLSFINRSETRKKLSFYQSIAARIVWICTSRKFERGAKRLTGHQARINKVPDQQVLEELKNLISSQSI